METIHYILMTSLLVNLFQGITIGIFFTPWAREKIVRRVLRLAQYGHKEFREVLDEVKREWNQ